MVSIHGPREHVTKWDQNFPLVKFGPQNCTASGYANFVTQFFHMLVTPCMPTKTMLPERLMVHVHYLAHNRL